MSDTIAVGQIWREVDPRFDRYVQVESVCTMLGNTNIVGIRAVVPNDHGGWDYTLGARYSRANAIRFNGKRGNYELVATPTSAPSA